MIALITGDIIDSRSVENPDIWLKPLKKLFQGIGKTPVKWEISPRRQLPS